MNASDLSAYKEVFLTSAKKHLEGLDYNLNLLKTTNETQEIVNDLYLHLHSLKGECGVMGYPDIMEKCEKALGFLKNEKQNLTGSQNVLGSISEVINSIKSDILVLENGTATQNST